MTRDDTTSNLPVRGRANSDTKAINKDNSSFPSRSGDSLQNPNSGNGKPNKHDAPSSHEAKGSGSPIVSTLKAEPKDGASISPRVGEASDAKLPRNKFSEFLKVYQFKSKSPEDGSTCIGNLRMSSFDRSSTLQQVREKMVKIHAITEKPCYKDGSPALDKFTLDNYLRLENEDIDFDESFDQAINSKTKQKNKTKLVAAEVYYAAAADVPAEPEKPIPKAPISASVLTQETFFIKVFQWEAADAGSTSRGTVQSSKLGTKEPAKMDLSSLREHIAKYAKMSPQPKPHIFCTRDGTSVTDESMTFSDYLKLEETPAAEGVDLPSVDVYYKLNSPKNEPRKIELSELKGSVEQEDYTLTGEEFKDGKQARAFQERERVSQITEGRIENGAASNPYAQDAGYLTEAEWAEVLRNCGIMYGWVIDRKNNKITRAPKPAFQLRPKTILIVNEETSMAVETTANIAPVAKVELSVPTTIKRVERKDTTLPVPVIAPRQIRFAPKSWQKKEVEGLTPPETDNQAPVDSSHQLTNQAENTDNPSGTELSENTTDATVQPATTSNVSTGNDPTGEEVVGYVSPEDATAAAMAEAQTLEEAAAIAKRAYDTAVAAAYAAAQQPPPSIRRAPKPVTTIMPSFQVNDDSRIEVTVSSHEFETSMAKNDFSSSETEGSLSAGYGGFAANVTAGHSKNTSQGSVDTKNDYNKTMIAKYLYPRADVLLHSSDLELTSELQEAILKVQRGKNIADLRTIYRDFGQLWCQRVTVGGRLQSTKTMASSEKSKEQSEKESFKTSVGLQVTTPFGVGAGVKHSQGSGTEKLANLAQIDKAEKNVFEAVGGDTILASNPEAWASTVADYRNWRVIDRASLTSMADAISALPGFASVKSWFIQAGPTLSRYLELPPSREIKLRFKLLSPTSETNMSLSYLRKQGKDMVTSGNNNTKVYGQQEYYLGHTQAADVIPRQTLVTPDWKEQITVNNALPLFSPQRYRGPVIKGYDSNQVGDASYGTKYNQEFTNTLWNISAPFDEALKHGSRVYIQTVPLPKVQNKAADDKDSKIIPTPPEPPLSLVVFRNQQAVFLPGLSDASERHFWRIHKVDAKHSEEFIKEGDEIFFSFAFKDQVSGFRDFLSDVFGRRRLQMPAELQNQRLFLKLPWPRFESLSLPSEAEKGNSLLLTPDLPTRGDLAKLIAIQTLPGIDDKAMAKANGRDIHDTKVYALQDVTFRVDGVGSEESGEADDFLLKGLDQSNTAMAPDAKVDPRLKLLRSALEFQYILCEQMMFLGML